MPWVLRVLSPLMAVLGDFHPALNPWASEPSLKQSRLCDGSSKTPRVPRPGVGREGRAKPRVRGG